MGSTITKDVIIRVRTDWKGSFDKTSEEVSHIRKEVEDLGDGTKKAVTKYMKGSRITKEVVEKTTDSTKKLSQMALKWSKIFKKSVVPFQGWALSIMFAGMAIERVFRRIMVSSLDTFMKISEGTTEASRSVITLSAEWEYLKYVAGSAFASLIQLVLPVLVGIITKVRDFIKENPKLTSALLVTAVVVGALLTFFGMFILTTASLADAMAFLGVTTLPALIGSFYIFMSVILIVIVAIALLFMIMANDSLTASDKFGASLATVGGAIAALGIMFTSLPAIILGAILLCIGILTFFADEIKAMFNIAFLEVKKYILIFKKDWKANMTESILDARDRMRELLDVAMTIAKFLNWDTAIQKLDEMKLKSDEYYNSKAEEYIPEMEQLDNEIITVERRQNLDLLDLKQGLEKKLGISLGSEALDKVLKEQRKEIDQKRADSVAMSSAYPTKGQIDANQVISGFEAPVSSFGGYDIGPNNQQLGFSSAYTTPTATQPKGMTNLVDEYLKSLPKSSGPTQFTDYNSKIDSLNKQMEEQKVESEKLKYQGGLNQGQVSINVENVYTKQEFASDQGWLDQIYEEAKRKYGSSVKTS